MAELVIQSNPTNGKDTYIASGTNVANNYGAVLSLAIGGDSSRVYRALLRFDLSALPPGAAISAAILEMYLNSGEADSAARNIDVHRGLTEWYEGVKSGTAPDAGQDGSTWNLRNTNGSVVWGTGGGTPGGLAGTDYATNRTARASVGVTANVTYTWDVTADAVAWVANPAANFGLWLKTETEAAYQRRLFLSSDYTDVPTRCPKLTITYDRATVLGVDGPDGTYQSGDTISVTVRFSAAVDVTGTPQLTLAFADGNKPADYASGSGTDTLTFEYEVVTDDLASDLDYAGTDSLVLNDGTIKYQGTSVDAILTLATPGAAGSLAANANIAVEARPFVERVQARYDHDVAGIAAAIGASALDSSAKSDLLANLTEAAAGLNAAGIVEDGFDCVLPYEEAHAALFAVQADLWRQLGYTAFRAWHVNRWSFTNAYDTPSDTPGIGSLTLLKGESGSVLIRVANPTEATVTLSLTLSDLSAVATVYKGVVTDTHPMPAGSERTSPVLARLDEITPSDGTWGMDVLPGFIGEFWITLAPTTEVNKTITARIMDGTNTTSVPIAVRVYDVAFPTTKLPPLGEFSNINPDTRTTADLIAFWGSYYNSPAFWPVVSVTESPFSLTPDTSFLDIDVAAYPHAPYYFGWRDHAIITEFDLKLTDGGIDDPDFADRWGAWAAAWYAYFQSLGIEDRAYLMILDEPDTDEEAEFILPHLAAIKAAAPNLRLATTMHAKLVYTVDPAFLAAHSLYLTGWGLAQDVAATRKGLGETTGITGQEVIAELRKYGDVLTYGLTPDAHGNDPYYAIRMDMWRHYALGLTLGTRQWLGSGGTGTGSPVPFLNAYSVQADGWQVNPAFVSATTVYNSKQCEGIRAGYQDYALLRHLADLIDVESDAARKASAQVVLDEAVAGGDLTEKVWDYYAWHSPSPVKNDYTALDALHDAMLEQIIVLDDRHSATTASAIAAASLPAIVFERTPPSALAATAGQYLSRTVDLLLYDGMQAEGDALLTPALVQPGQSGAEIAGIQKLAQRFLLELFTTSGSLQYLPDRGCGFMDEARQGTWRTEADVEQAFYIALLDIRRNLLAEETEDDPDDERFGDAQLLAVTVQIDRVTITIQVTSLAGSARTVLFPLRVNKL